MNLWEYYGQLVRVSTKNGDLCEGKVDGYRSEWANLPDPEMIRLGDYTLYAPEIENIEPLPEERWRGYSIKYNHLRLWQYHGKLVRVTLKNGHIYEGRVCEYTSDADNEPKPESICVGDYELYAPEIENIELLPQRPQKLRG